jgi:hypothetical protein
MSNRTFEDTVRNLLRMKPQPHKEKGQDDKEKADPDKPDQPRSPEKDD